MSEILDRYELVVGLEVHAQLSTETKLFCDCAARFGAAPNSLTCPTCLGHPGALPVVNAQALEKILRLAQALGAEIPELTEFDRKHYHYPDLPKNYQITQERRPVGRGGELRLIRSGGSVAFDNIHLEEDAGKLTHGADGQSLVDLNRAGTPLAELVTRPNLRSRAELEDLMLSLRALLLSIDVCDCRMEQGSLRFEASVSVRPWGQESMNKRSEIKNLNSMRAVLAAVTFERARQVALLESGVESAQETRLWDEAADFSEPAVQALWAEDLHRAPGGLGSEEIALEAVLALLPGGFRGRTRVMRSKEQAADYRFLPEPDLPPIATAPALARIAASGELPELPGERMLRYVEVLGLSAGKAEIIVLDPGLAVFFDELVALGVAPKRAAKDVLNQLLGWLGDRELDFHRAADCPLRPRDFAALHAAIEAGAITRDLATKKLLPRLLKARMEGLDDSVAELVEAGGYSVDRDRDKLRGFVAEALAANPKALADIERGKKKARGSLVGYVMKMSRGKAPPQLVNELLDEALAKRSQASES